MSENRGCCRKLFWVFACSATILRWSEKYRTTWPGLSTCLFSGILDGARLAPSAPSVKWGWWWSHCSLPLGACDTVCDVLTCADWGRPHLHRCPLCSWDCSHSRRWWFPLSFCLFSMILMAWKGSESFFFKGILDGSSQRTAGLFRAVAAEPEWCQPIPRGPGTVPRGSPQRVSTRILPWALGCRHLPASPPGGSEIHHSPRP